MNIFLDTEFTDLVGMLFDPALISIGLISEDGELSFYAELADNYTLDMCSYFVLENVIPLLDSKPINSLSDSKNIHGTMTIEECRQNLYVWLEQFKTPVQIWSDAPNYDWGFLSAIFQGHPWPSMLLTKPKSLVLNNTEINRLYETGGYRKHHALDDAIVIQKTWKLISEVR